MQTPIRRPGNPRPEAPYRRPMPRTAPRLFGMIPRSTAINFIALIILAGLVFALQLLGHRATSSSNSNEAVTTSAGEPTAPVTTAIEEPREPAAPTPTPEAVNVEAPQPADTPTPVATTAPTTSAPIPVTTPPRAENAATTAGATTPTPTVTPTAPSAENAAVTTLPAVSTAPLAEAAPTAAPVAPATPEEKAALKSAPVVTVTAPAEKTVPTPPKASAPKPAVYTLKTTPPSSPEATAEKPKIDAAKTRELRKHATIARDEQRSTAEDRKVNIDDLDGEAARRSYWSQNQGVGYVPAPESTRAAPTVVTAPQPARNEMQDLAIEETKKSRRTTPVVHPTSEGDLDGEGARQGYIAENHRQSQGGTVNKSAVQPTPPPTPVTPLPAPASSSPRSFIPYEQ